MRILAGNFHSSFFLEESQSEQHSLPTHSLTVLSLYGPPPFTSNMPSSAHTENIAIRPHGDNTLRREVSRSLSMSTSPTDTFHQRKMSMGFEGTSPNLRRITTGAPAKHLKPFREQDIKILLLENVNQTGRDILQGQGYQVEALKSSLPEDQLIEKIKYCHELLSHLPTAFSDLSQPETFTLLASAARPNSMPVSSQLQGI